jgi:hypothetical protein
LATGTQGNFTPRNSTLVWGGLGFDCSTDTNFPLTAFLPTFGDDVVRFGISRSLGRKPRPLLINEDDTDGQRRKSDEYNQKGEAQRSIAKLFPVRRPVVDRCFRVRLDHDPSGFIASECGSFRGGATGYPIKLFEILGPLHKGLLIRRDLELALSDDLKQAPKHREEERRRQDKKQGQ